MRLAFSSVNRVGQVLTIPRMKGSGRQVMRSATSFPSANLTRRAQIILIVKYLDYYTFRLDMVMLVFRALQHHVTYFFSRIHINKPYTPCVIACFSMF